MSSAADRLTLDTLDIYLRSLRGHGAPGGRRPGAVRKTAGQTFEQIAPLRFSGLG